MGRKMQTLPSMPGGRAGCSVAVEEGKARRGPVRRGLVVPHVGGFGPSSQGSRFYVSPSYAHVYLLGPCCTPWLGTGTGALTQFIVPCLH